MNETNNAYIPNAIDPAILSVLDVELEGKVVTAETWKSLWNLVLTHINSIDTYLVTIEQFRIEWEQGLELFNTIVEEFRVKYEALASSFIHYGVDEPTNEHIQLWCEPVRDVQDYGFIMATNVNYRGYFPLGEVVLNDTLRTGLYSIAKGSTFVFKQNTTALLESVYTAASHGLLIVSENENSTHTEKIIQFTFYGTLAEEATANEITNGVYSACIKKTLSDDVWTSEASDFHNITEDISRKQDKADNSLHTTDKTVVGAINENKDSVDAINGKIPNQATAQNQLADKDFVNSSLNSITAFYITKNTQGDPFSTKSELNNTTVFYSGGEVRVPTRNDYCFVLADESKTDPLTEENPSTRYVYNGGWEFQFIVNKTSLTAEQLAAVNSGITASKVEEINGKYVKPNTGIPKTDLANDVKQSLEKADTALQEHQNIDGKQDKFARTYAEDEYEFLHFDKDIHFAREAGEEYKGVTFYNHMLPKFDDVNTRQPLLPTEDKDAVCKKYVDNHHDDTKQDKLTNKQMAAVDSGISESSWNEVYLGFDNKQNKLIAGDNITIDPVTNVISASSETEVFQLHGYDLDTFSNPRNFIGHIFQCLSDYAVTESVAEDFNEFKQGQFYLLWDEASEGVPDWKKQEVVDVSKFMTTYQFIYDGTNIRYNGRVATFDEVKDKCLDDKYFVYLTYQNRLYIPNYVTDTDIYFGNNFNVSGKVYQRRINIQASGVVGDTQIELAKITDLSGKQDNLTAGENITIDPTTNVISASGGKEWKLIYDDTFELDDNKSIETFADGTPLNCHELFIYGAGCTTDAAQARDLQVHMYDGNVVCYVSKSGFLSKANSVIPTDIMNGWIKIDATCKIPTAIGNVGTSYSNLAAGNNSSTNPIGLSEASPHIRELEKIDKIILVSGGGSSKAIQSGSWFKIYGR